MRLAIPAAAVRVVVRATFRPLLSPRVPVRLQRLAAEALVRPLNLTGGVRVRSVRLGGVPVEVVEHEGADASAAVLYLHGGGYCILSPATYRSLAAQLALAAGCPVHLPRYRLAPEHPHPAALEDALAAYRALIGSGLSPGRVVVAGDSAGAGLAVAVALRLRDRGEPLPAALALVSPWLDLGLGGPSTVERAAVDPLLTASWLRRCARSYRGRRALDDPEISPLSADLRGLPPVLVQSGADDIILSDAERFAGRARAAGVRVDLQRFDGLWHDFQVLAGVLAPARAALDGMGAYVRARIEGSTAARPTVAIIGAGFGGLGMGIRLKQAGLHDFTILERADHVGGVWRDNTYPGAACDVASHIYSYSFERNRDWSRRFAPQPDILAYMERCVDRYGLAPHLRLGVEVAAADFDEARRRWRLRTTTGETLEADVLVTACGQLSRPAYPSIPGIERFAGTRFHSARWDHGCDMTGRRVAVIGTGASAVQFVPEVARRAERLHVFQRSASWVIPKLDTSYRSGRRRLRRLPVWPTLARAGWYAFMELATAGLVGAPWVIAPLRAASRAMLRLQVPDPALRRRLVPDHELGCKRVLISSDYYRALARPNVELVTDPVREITETGVVTADGVERSVDAIVFGTGFAANDLLAPIRIRGLGGRSLDDAWRDGAEAYLGISVSGFPNLFLMYGPNTNLGAGSVIHMLEAQMTWIVGALRELTRSGAGVLDVRDTVQREFDREIQDRLRTSVWTSGCTSWYRTRSGRVVNNWPGLVSEYRRRTRRFDPAAYRVLA